MNLKNTAEYTLFKIFFAVLRRLPYSWSVAILKRLGQWASTMRWTRGPLVARQLAAAFPKMTPLDLVHLKKQVYDHLALTVAEVFCTDTASLLATVEIDPGWESLDQAVGLGRGVIIATAHAGNFELGGAVLAGRYSVLDVVKAQRNDLFDQYLETQRRAFGIQTVPMPDSGPATLKQLRSGGLVTLLMDQDAGAEGVAVPFFGRLASTWPGAARLSLRTGAPVVPMAMRRLPDGGHQLRIRPALEPTAYDNTADGVQDYLTAISREVQAFIQDAPAQWFWVHRRWKTDQGGIPNNDLDGQP